MKRTTDFARCALGAVVLALLWGSGCVPPDSPESHRPPRAQKWFERASREFRDASIDSAHDSVRKALDIVPEDRDVRVLAAKVALARLEYDEALRLLRGIDSSRARSLRGRAYWYDGELERAAEELDVLLDDPDVEDPWAKQISKLAHRGTGRKPFDVTTTEGRLETVQMAKVEGAPLFIVPVEIDGEEALSLVATGRAEVTLDSASRNEPSWVSLRFGERLEVRDVPAVTEDLTTYSMKLGAPIKALLGANLLRHLNATLDLSGRQFVARDFSPPPPPVASRVDVWYLLGGGMVLGGSLGEGKKSDTKLYVDSSMEYNLALDRGGWNKVGVDLETLEPISGNDDGLKRGPVPVVQLGAFKLPHLPAVYGPVDYDARLDIDVDGAVGAGLLSNFRLTFADRGRVLWVEQRPPVGPPPDRLPPPGTPPPGGRGGGVVPGTGSPMPGVGPTSPGNQGGGVIYPSPSLTPEEDAP